MAWNDKKAKKDPTVRDIPVGREWTWYFAVPYESMGTWAPARGTDVSALQPFVKFGCVGVTGKGARVISRHLSKTQDEGYILTLVVGEPQALTAGV